MCSTSLRATVNFLASPAQKSGQTIKVPWFFSRAEASSKTSECNVILTVTRKERFSVI